MKDALSPPAVASDLTEPWSRRVVAEFEDSYLKVAKVKGELGWHSHDGEDEIFFILSGRLRIAMVERAVGLNAGDAYVVAKGVVLLKPSAFPPSLEVR